MHELNTFLQAQLKPFDRSALWQPQILAEGGLVIACWTIPAFAFVWLVNLYRVHLPSVYFDAAIAEGIGPHLWNVVGTIGFILVGLSFLFPRSTLIAKSAYQVLINTYAIGGLTFGLLLGQMATTLTEASATFAAWKIWLMSAGGIFLALQVLSLNFSLWYLGHLVLSREQSNGFRHRLEQVDLRLRLLAFALFALLPMVLLSMEK